MRSTHPLIFKRVSAHIAQLSILGVVILAFTLAAAGLTFASDVALSQNATETAGAPSGELPEGLVAPGKGSAEETEAPDLAPVIELGPSLGLAAMAPQAPGEITILSAGSYQLHWAAADPKLNSGTYHPTYAKLTPDQVDWVTYPLTGRAADPLEDAVAYSPLAGTADYVQSLTPENMELGCIVPFEAIVSVNGDTSAESGAITLYPRFGAMTTSGSDFGYSPEYGIIAAFVDTGDAGTIDPGGNATVSFLGNTIVDGGTPNEATLGTITVEGLDDGDRAVIEIWVVLDQMLPAGATGNVPTELSGAETGTVVGAGDPIGPGAETVPLLRVRSFAERAVDMSVEKYELVDPVPAGERVQWVIVVTNEMRPSPLSTWTANGVFVEDNRGPGLTLMPDSMVIEGATGTPYVEWTEGRFSVLLGTMAASQVVTITVDAVVNDSAPQTATEESPADLPDRMNTVTVTSVNPEYSAPNNVDIEFTGVIPAAVPTISVSIVPDPVMRFEPGGEFKFTYVVTNTSETTVTLDSLYDTMLGYLPLPPTPVVIGPGASSPPFEATTTYTAVGTYAHLVAAYAHDQFGQLAGAIDSTSVFVGELPDYTDVSVNKYDGFDPVLANRLQAYFILASNESSLVAAQNVVVTDQLPDSMLFVPTTILISGVTSPYTWQCVDNLLTVTIDELDPMQTVTISYRAIVRAQEPMTGAPGGLSDLMDRYNEAMISTETTENYLLNNVEGEWSGVIPLAKQLLVTKTPIPAVLPDPGGMFDYQVIVTNVSTNTLTLTEVYDDVIGMLELPEDLVLSPGESSAPIMGSALHMGEGTFDNTAYALAAHPGGFRVGEWDEASVRVVPNLADLSITKAASHSVVRAGHTMTYSLVVHNMAEVPASGTVVTDTLDDGTTFVPGSVRIMGAPGATSDYSAGVLTVNLGDLAAEATVVIEFDVVCDIEMPMSMTWGDEGSAEDRVNVATVISEIEDPDLTNNTAFVATGVMPPSNPAIRVTKTAAPARLSEPGGTFTYTYLVSNVGSDTLTVLSLKDNIIGTLALPADVVLSPGETMKAVTANWSATAVGKYTNIVTVVAEQEEGVDVQATASATVEIYKKELPFTGADITKWLLASLALIGIGIALRGRKSGRAQHAAIETAHASEWADRERPANS